MQPLGGDWLIAKNTSCVYCIIILSYFYSAKPYESMKLMLVGLQKQGKTTLLTRLREINEVRTPISTFNERKEGESMSAAVSLKPSSATGPVGFFRKIGSKDGKY